MKTSGGFRYSLALATTLLCCGCPFSSGKLSGNVQADSVEVVRRAIKALGPGYEFPIHVEEFHSDSGGYWLLLVPQSRTRVGGTASVRVELSGKTTVVGRGA